MASDKRKADGQATRRKSMSPEEAIRAVETGGLVWCSRQEFYGGVRAALQKFEKRMREAYGSSGKRDLPAKRLADIADKVVVRLDSRYMSREPTIRAPLPERRVGAKFAVAFGVEARRAVPPVARVQNRPQGEVGAAGGQ